MSGFEWFLLIVIVIAVPLIVAVAVTLWTLEQARQRNRRFRETGSTEATPTKRRATREGVTETVVVTPRASAAETTQTTATDDASHKVEIDRLEDDEDDHDAPPTLEPAVAPGTLRAEPVDPDAQWKPHTATVHPRTQETPAMPNTSNGNVSQSPAGDSARNANPLVRTGFSETTADNPEVDTDAVQVSTTTPVAPDAGEGDPSTSDTSSWNDTGETRTHGDSDGHIVGESKANPRSDTDAGPST